MNKFEAANKANEFLAIALEDIRNGNFFLAKSYLRDALSYSNKARSLKLSGKIMKCMHIVTEAAKA